MKNPQNWSEQDTFLTQTFEFENFKAAIHFINQVADLAEAHHHHPNIQLFNYKRVKIEMHTNSEGGKITEKDTNLAEAINQIT